MGTVPALIEMIIQQERICVNSDKHEYATVILELKRKKIDFFDRATGGSYFRLGGLRSFEGMASETVLKEGMEIR